MRVFYTAEKAIEIEYAADKAHTLTTGWLFSEVIRKLMETDGEWFFARKAKIDLIALESRKKPGQSLLSTLDYWLLCFDHDLQPLRSRHELQLITSQLRDTRSKTEAMSMDHFEI